MRNDDRGLAMLEAVLVFPALIAILLFVSLAGRLSASQNEVLAAARSAARAGSQADTPDAAQARAQAVALDSLAEGSLRCTGSPAVLVNTDGWIAGGAVVVTVRCNVELSDLGLLGLGGVRTVSGTSTAAIDSFRELSP